MVTTLRGGPGPSGPDPEEADAEPSARAGKPASAERKQKSVAIGWPEAKRARVSRRHRPAAASAGAASAPPAAEGALLTTAQLRGARKLMREKQASLKKEREFGRRLVTTLTEGQNALNIAFGAILSAYIGTVLTAIDDRPFNQWTLAAFFVLIGVFIGGLCIGNLVVLRKHFGLGVGFLAVGAVAAYLSLGTARVLGFELPILRVMFICWYAMLVATDGLLTAIIFFHHRSVVRRHAQAARARAARTAA